VLLSGEAVGAGQHFGRVGLGRLRRATGGD
jgi:hypothetical protein